MSRSAHTFLPKKLVAGMGIGAIAMLAMAGPALTDDEKGSKKKTKCSRSRPSYRYHQLPGRGRHVLFV